MKHTSDAAGIDVVAIGILRRDDALVLVQQRNDQGTYWVLPGGLVEVGELLVDALAREVREECGATVEETGPLAFCTQIDRGRGVPHHFFFIFEVAAWSGALESDDPDAEIVQVALVPFADALGLLESNGGWRGVQEPLRAYLRGEVRPGTVWCYREEGRDQHFVARI